MDKDGHGRRHRLDVLWTAVGAGVALAGYLGPWIPHKTAALTVTGFELAEFAKFFPQVQGDAVPLDRMLFYLPLVAIIVLAAWRSVLWSRRVSFLLAGFLVVLLLPYAVLDAARPALTAHVPFAPEPAYLEQLFLVLVGVLLTPAGYRVAALPVRTRRMLKVGLAAVALGAALWQFALLYPLVAALYGHPPGVGWGVVACGVGLMVLSFS